MEKVLHQLSEIRSQIETLQKQNATLKKKNTALERKSTALKKESTALKKTSTALEKKSTALEMKSTVLENELSISRKVHIGIRHGVLKERRISNRAGVCKARKDRKTTIIRNEIAHGGDIIGDIKAIQYAQEERKPYVAEYKEDFEKVYQVSFDDALTQASSYPLEAIRAFNILASVSELYAWQACDQQNHRQTIEEQATKIIKAVLSTKQKELQARFGNEGDLEVVFNEMVGLFMTGR
ncbi:hypothetical protein EMCG_05060 [[Emmonsia] crescens]|uniref:Uncharacterized protein n=1 Tax=[Emmonsia] crescens TaxID=73230 RepID=A0A0G2HQ64_9EURO|nr:hypothetical protein EMCG_05060 [Emmonsia crescens UAMH 3008]